MGVAADARPKEVRSEAEHAAPCALYYDLHESAGDGVAEAPETYAVDLTQVPGSGLELWMLDGLEVGSWELGYQTPQAGSATARHASVSVQDFESMVSGELTYLVRGTITKADGVSCPPSGLAEPAATTSVGSNDAGDPCFAAPSIDFEIAAASPTRFGPCQIDGIPGVVITQDATQTAALTIHGDHLFFNGFPEGSEGGISRLAQWLADADLDVDGEVTREELEAIALSDLDEIDDRFQLGGSPVTPLETVWDYVVAQLKTQGHFQGEGECPIDGEAHVH